MNTKNQEHILELSPESLERLHPNFDDNFDPTMQSGNIIRYVTYDYLKYYFMMN